MIGLLARLSRSHINHRKIAASAAIIGVLTLIAKVFAAGREMAIAWRFGVGPIADAYQLALTITTWLPMMLASAATAVLVPRLVSLRSQAAEREAFVAEANGSVLILAIGMAALIWLAGPAIASALGGDLGPQTVRATAQMSRALTPIVVLSVLIFYLSARLQALERFSYSVTEALPAIAIALMVIAPLALHGEDRLVLGTLVGFGLQLIALIWLMRRHGHFGPVGFRQSSPYWRSFYANLTFMAAGQAVLAFSIPIDQAFAAATGNGSVAILGYANRILLLLSTMGTVVVGRALLPVLADTFARGDAKLARSQALQWGALLFATAVIGVCMLWMLSPMLIRLLFERGAFDITATIEVTNVFRVGLLQLPFYFGGIALVQYYAAAGFYREMLVINLIALAVKVALNFLLVPVYSLWAILASTAAMYFVSASLLLAMSGRRPRPSPHPVVDRPF